ncbi:hypothetical protein [Burkholderia cepacia]|nr:hypothetical protein [Burkholderia cepacia]UIY56643.1 hypothetical protein LZ568_17765 [Burkholderia cepacia]
MLDIKIDDLLIVNNMQTTESKTTERQEGWPPVIRRGRGATVKGSER